MQDFVDDLSNWYVRRCRERYWGKDMTADKEAAYMTLYTVLRTMRADSSAPFTPFMSETMYQNMVRTVDTRRAGERTPLRLAQRRTRAS